MANRVSNDQMEELLDFLIQHPAIAKGVGLGARSKEAVERQWNDLANRLNSYGSGSTKSGERWKKYWADLKHKSKTRLAKRRRDALGTGGGPSSQDELSEIDKKVLAIIGEQAVFGDIEHRVPIFNIDEEIHESESQRIDVPAHNSRTPDIVMLVSPIPAVPLVNSPSRQGQTSQVVRNPQTSIISDAIHQTVQSPQAGVESPLSRPNADRPRLRRHRPNTTNSSRINSEWVIELERKRVEAETKLANAALIIAEASRVQVEVSKEQVEASRVQVEVTRGLVELISRQSDDMRALLEMMRASNRRGSE